MVAEIAELIKIDYPFVEIRLFQNEWDVYAYNRYSGITIKDGDLGLIEDVLKNLKLEIDYYIKVRQYTFNKADDIDKAKVIETRKTKNDSKRLSNRSRIRNKRKH